MAHIISVNGKQPTYGKDCFLAVNATLVGDIIMGDQCSVWFNAVIRGDVNAIRIGNKVNIQDGAVIHCTYQKTQTHIADRVSIGHKAIVHGCRIEENVLVGMGCIIMDGAHIGSNSIIAAGAVVTENMIVESGSVYAGIPAKKIKTVDQDLLEGEINRIADNYVMYSGWFNEKK